jgi:transcriptional regulator with XRE-family HTH domain/Zn-dependent peptidase ImmA (M78 family)
MIKNERQYRITKAQVKRFDEAIRELQDSGGKGDPPVTHPLLITAQIDALKSQVEELNEELREYDALQSGERAVLEVNSFAELPKALIQARIAAQLSQKELASRLALKEQQIQQYESTGYASASVERISQVIDALGITVREEVFLPTSELSLSRLLKRLQTAGLHRDFVVKRLIPSRVAASLESAVKNVNTSLVLQAASSVAQIFGWPLKSLLSSDIPLDLNMAAVGAGRFKIPASASEQTFNAYTVYAHILSLLTLEATKKVKRRAIPIEADEVRKEVVSEFGSVTFENVLRYVWSRGIPVLPLRDAGGFHGACWRQKGRNIIVLKQTTKSVARWLFDLLHELWHTNEDPEDLELSIVEESQTAISRRESYEEQAASQFAGEIILEGRAEELVRICLAQADSDVKRIKSTLPRVARAEGVSVASLANYMAFRLTMSGYNWWGTATNLQDENEGPWKVAREMFFEYVDLSVLNEFDRNLLQQALRDESLV